MADGDGEMVTSAGEPGADRRWDVCPEECSLGKCDRGVALNSVGPIAEEEGGGKRGRNGGLDWLFAERGGPFRLSIAMGSGSKEVKSKSSCSESSASLVSTTTMAVSWASDWQAVVSSPRTAYVTLFVKLVAGRLRNQSSCSVGAPFKNSFGEIKMQLSSRELRADEIECEENAVEGACLESPKMSTSRIVERSFGIEGSGEGFGCRGA